MRFFSCSIRAFSLFLLFLSSCDSPEVIHDLSDSSYQLVNQDSTYVNFPPDFKGDILVVGFIYTHCPDICPIITANMNNIKSELDGTSNVHFAVITFDPKRDTPSVLKQYAQNFRLEDERFTLLTGDPGVVDSLLSHLNVKAEISYTKTTDKGKDLYFMNHTNRILVMDRRGRVRMEYPGSAVPPENVIQDIQTLQ